MVQGEKKLSGELWQDRSFLWDSHPYVLPPRAEHRLDLVCLGAVYERVFRGNTYGGGWPSSAGNSYKFLILVELGPRFLASLH